MNEEESETIKDLVKESLNATNRSLKKESVINLQKISSKFQNIPKEFPEKNS